MPCSTMHRVPSSSSSSSSASGPWKAEATTTTTTRTPALLTDAPILDPGWAWQGSVYVHSSLRPIGHRLARPASLTARSSAERPAWRPAPRCPVTAPSTARETGGRTTSREGLWELRVSRMSQAKRPGPPLARHLRAQICEDVSGETPNPGQRRNESCEDVSGETARTTRFV